MTGKSSLNCIALQQENTFNANRFLTHSDQGRRVTLLSHLAAYTQFSIGFIGSIGLLSRACCWYLGASHQSIMGLK